LPQRAKNYKFLIPSSSTTNLNVIPESKFSNGKGPRYPIFFLGIGIY
jgi:hypothetical protein